MTKKNHPLSVVVGFGISMVLGLIPNVAFAIEGGIETYLLGSRDSMAGALPPPGTYLNNDLQFYSASVDAISLGGVAIVDPKLKALVYKFSLTHVTEQTLWGGALAFNLNIPLASGTLDATGVVGSGLSGNLSDSQLGIGDIVVSPILGWQSGNTHTNFTLQIFLPVGNYNVADVSASPPTFDVLNIGKNRFAVDPTISRSFFNPETGFEISGALGVTISSRNNATDYQTAPEAHFEGTVAQHFANGWLLGATGYAYQQIGDDSGAGADSLRAAIGADSLQARVYGLGPIISYSTKIGGRSVSFKAKYIKEFGAKRRFEGEKLWLTLGIVF